VAQLGSGFPCPREGHELGPIFGDPIGIADAWARGRARIAWQHGLPPLPGCFRDLCCLALVDRHVDQRERDS